MGDSGNDFQRLLVAPASERLLNLQPGETVLEIACGNGVFTRRMAQLGVHVIATDFSEQFLEHARARHSAYADTSNTASSMPPAKSRLSPSGSTVSMLLYATWLLWTWLRSTR